MTSRFFILASTLVLLTGGCASHQAAEEDETPAATTKAAAKRGSESKPAADDGRDGPKSIGDQLLDKGKKTGLKPGGKAPAEPASKDVDPRAAAALETLMAKHPDATPPAATVPAVSAPPKPAPKVRPAPPPPPETELAAPVQPPTVQPAEEIPPAAAVNPPQAAAQPAAAAPAPAPVSPPPAAVPAIPPAPLPAAPAPAPAGLDIKLLRICTRVEGFGRFTPMDVSSLPSNRVVPMLIYTEYDGFTHRTRSGFAAPTGNEVGADDGSAEWVIELSQKVVIFDADGRQVQVINPQTARDVSSRRRRDHFLVQRIDLNPLKPGTYTLKVTGRDSATGSEAEAKTTFTLSR